jgi:ribosome-binding protein aMBF1 (putative translation factor)
VAGLIEALGAAAEKARKDHGVSRAQVAVSLGRGEETVARFERAEVLTALDEMLDAYVDTTGVSLMDLLSEAERTLKKNG